MGTVDDKHDYVLNWCVDKETRGAHNQKPVFLSAYVDALERLVISGDSGPDDLERLRRRMGLASLTALKPRIVADTSTLNTSFSTHSWVGREVAEAAYCVKCGVSSNSIQAMKDCSKGAIRA